MEERVADLIEEKDRLNKRLAQLNVQSIGRERIKQRIQMINEELRSMYALERVEGA